MKATKIVMGLFFLSLLVGKIAVAEEKQKIAVVKFQQAMLLVDEGKQARAQLEKDFQPKMKKKDDMEKELRTLQEAYQKKASVMNAEAKQKKEIEMQSKMAAYQEYIQKSNGELQEMEKKLSAPIIEGLRSTIAEVAKDKGYTLVMNYDENMIMFVSSSDDLTNDIVAKFNSKKKK